MRELATAFGIHRLTVSAHLRQHGVQIRGRGLDEELIPEVARLYEAGCSSWTLSEKYDVTPNTILSALRRAGARIRPGRGGPPRGRKAS